MARFVLLFHECPAGDARASHWDLMLEADGVLRTWAVAQLPRSWREVWARTATIFAGCPPLSDVDRVAAERLVDHRIEYLKLEGPLSGDRGTVQRIDEGTYEIVSENSDGCRLRLFGALVRGNVSVEASVLTIGR